MLALSRSPPLQNRFPLRTTHIDLLSCSWVKHIFVLLPHLSAEGTVRYGRKTRLEEAHALARRCSRRSRKLVHGTRGHLGESAMAQSVSSLCQRNFMLRGFTILIRNRE